MLTCAATIVRTATNRTAAARNAPTHRARGDGLQQRAAVEPFDASAHGWEFYSGVHSTDNCGERFAGGAGIQADLKTFAAWGVYGTCADPLSATAQNTGVHGGARPQRPVIAQIEAVAEDLAAAAVKTACWPRRQSSKRSARS
jgi:hypothetical protein